MRFCQRPFPVGIVFAAAGGPERGAALRAAAARGTVARLATGRAAVFFFGGLRGLRGLLAGTAPTSFIAFCCNRAARLSVEKNREPGFFAMDTNQ